MHVVTKALSFSFSPWTDNIKIQAMQYSWPFHPCDKERVRNKRMTCTDKSIAFVQREDNLMDSVASFKNI